MDDLVAVKINKVRRSILISRTVFVVYCCYVTPEAQYSLGKPFTDRVSQNF